MRKLILTILFANQEFGVPATKPFCGGRTDASNDDGYSDFLKVLPASMAYHKHINLISHVMHKIFLHHHYPNMQPKLHGNFSDDVEQLKEVVRLMGLTQVPLSMIIIFVIVIVILHHTSHYQHNLS